MNDKKSENTKPSMERAGNQAEMAQPALSLSLSLSLSLPFALCALLLLTAPVNAQSAGEVQAPATSTTSIDLSIAPRVPDEDKLIEEGYLTPEATREQAAIDHANEPASNATRLRYLHRNDTVLVETGVRLNRDLDNDGYFSAFSLEMDVDTRDQLEVYADIFLQRQYQSPRLLHSTRSFHLYGNSSSDEYRVDVTLTNNFPAGHYDLIIQIRDAWSDELLDSVSEADFRNLGGLPLEDESNRRLPRDDGSSVVVEYAGATTPLGLLALALSVAFLRLRGRVNPSESA